MKRLREKLSPWLVLAALIGVWQAVVVGFGIPRAVLPSASESFVAIWVYRDALIVNSLATLYATIVGFALAVAIGLGLGLAIGASRSLYAALYPLLLGFNATPKVALVPILIIWFGVNIWSPIITAFILSFFPIVVNVSTGLATIEPELRDVLRALGARERDILLKVGIPRSLPFFFASLKIAITLSFVGAVIAETVAGNEGIGHVMLVASSSFDTPLMFAGLIVIAVLAIVMYAIFAIADRRFTGWATRSMDYATGG